MRKIFLSAGHSNKAGRDRGAAGNGFIEGNETVRMRTRISEILKERFGVTVIMDGNDTILAESMNFFKKLTSPDSIVMDIHFNAGTSNSTGVETIVPKTPTDDELKLANLISKGVNEVLGIQLRGKFKNVPGVRSEEESQHKALGWMRLTGCNVLLETCFISNPTEIKTYDEKFEVLCQKLAEILFDFANNGTVKQDSLAKRVHTVIAGESLWSIGHAYGVSSKYLADKNNLTTNTLRVGQILEID